MTNTFKSWLRMWFLGPTGVSSLPSISANLDRYEAALDALEATEADAATLLAALIQRDQIAAVLAKGNATPKIVQRLTQLDHHLRQVAPCIPDTDWNAWRQTLSPPPDRCWWRLDEAHAKAEEKHSLPWTLLTGVLMTVTFSLAVEIIQRLWGSGPDGLSVVSTVFALVLTASPLTKRGRELAGWLMDKVHLPTRYRSDTMLGAACLAFAVTLLLRLALPALAVTCNNRGYALLQAGDLTGAQWAFARAVSINPDYAIGYYNLGDAYVDVGDYDKARSLYNQALAADRTLDLAYNGLGYVLILQGKPEQAVPILYTGLDLAQEDTVRAALWTNLGRAYLEAKRYHEAKTALTEALTLTPEEAAAHCTLARTAEALAHSEDEILLHWENCLRYADPTTPRGQELATVSRTHLQQLGENGQ